MAYQTTDDDGNVITCGEPNEQEKAMGDEESADEANTEEHHIRNFL